MTERWKHADGFADDVEGDLRSSLQTREALARFDSFYDFAFPRVYHYAQGRMENDVQAQILCRIVLVRAVSTLGGLETVEDRVTCDPKEFAFWLFCLARRAADELSARRAAYPDLFEGSGLEDELEDQTLELLRNTRAKRTAI